MAQRTLAVRHQIAPDAVPAARLVHRLLSPAIDALPELFRHTPGQKLPYLAAVTTGGQERDLLHRPQYTARYAISKLRQLTIVTVQP